ncbi:hypothetical protein [Desertivirga arenae]|uniref:hypothetical protein n=1 Tax=Desertivirga arenae TaxID=2810309 RepID=UPI001A95A11E|nr:hypothetical protein [Pedobacter sp. SYSU D00823]
MMSNKNDLFEKLKGDLVIIQFRTLLDTVRANKGLLPADSIKNLDRIIRQEMAAYIFKAYPELNIPDEEHYAGENRCYFPDKEIFLN